MMRKIFLFSFILFLGARFLLAQDFYDNRLLVSLQSNATAWPEGQTNRIQSKISSTLSQLFETYHVLRVERWLKSADERDVWHGIDFRKIYRLHLQDGAVMDEARKAFGALPSVQLAEREPVVRIASPLAATVPNDPLFDRQWYLRRIMADFAWSLSAKIPQNEAPILIGIVDTGIDYLHPELGPALYVNPGEDIDGDGKVTGNDYNGVDDDGNGFVDDLLGWDFSEASDSISGDNDIRPPVAGANEILSHGTHVAGIAGAVPDNGIGISGIARNYRIIGTKHSRDTDYKHGYLYNAYDGVLYAAKMGADVINCSWGGSGFSQEAQNLINLVSEHYGAIVVAAAGNDNNNNDHKHFYPSDLDNVITVAALDPSDHKASFSNYGQVIDISAPGQSIFSTIHYYKGGYASWAGTSMASPIVTGSFALLKAFFPDLPRDSLIARLLRAADPLNNANLGSGRVNIFHAIAPRFLPGLRVVGDSLTVQDANGNGQIDPGETIWIGLKMENRKGWQDAHQVTITAHSIDSLVVFSDSVAYLGDINSGTSKDTDRLDFTAKVDKKHPYGPFTLTFTITCNPDSAIAVREHYSLPVLLSTFQRNFPWKQSGSLLPISLLQSNNDHKKYLVFISPDYQLYLLDAAGQVKPGFPFDLQEYHRVAPVIVDLNNDGEPELVTVSQRGQVRAITTSGDTLWQKHLGQTVYGNVAAADLDGDGQPELVLATMQKQLHVLDVRGAERAGFPLEVGSFVDKGVALADVNGDSLPEIVYGTFDRKLHCLNAAGHELPGWPVDLPVRVHFTPVIGRDAQGVHIFVADHNNRIEVFGAQGQVQRDTLLSAEVAAQPALGDVDGDGSVDFIAPFSDGAVYAFSLNGNVWQLTAQGIDAPVDLEPLFISSDLQKRVFLGASKGALSVLNGRGRALSFSPVHLTQTLAAAPVVGDLDDDGDLEFISADDKEIMVLDLPDSLNGFSGWPTIMGNNRRTGYLEIGKATAVKKPHALHLPQTIELKVAPNPFNAAARIKLRIPLKDRDKRLRVAIYNINGQRIRTLYEGLSNSGRFQWIWRGRNNFGKVVSSGLYFVTIELDDHWFGQQILFVK